MQRRDIVRRPLDIIINKSVIVFFSSVDVQRFLVR